MPPSTKAADQQALTLHATDFLARTLADAPERDRRIVDLYLPVLRWLLATLESTPGSPLTIGLNAPQGAGKTTLVRQLVPLLGDLGVRTAALSIDDFYWPRAEQQRLAAEHPGNRYLEHRGAPGTHDVALGTRTLTALRALAPGQSLALPTYDKSQHQGRGDRAPEATWPRVEGPLDLVLLDGWMLGFRPVASEGLDPHLREINERLACYQPWLDALDGLICLRVDDLAHIPRWRIEAEESAARAGKPGLDRAAIEDYIRRFLPAYALYADTLEAGRFCPDRQLVIRLGGDRLPVRPAARS